MSTLWQDIRYGFRILVKNPAFSLVVVVLVAVGVGVNTAVFSIFNGFLIRPLPYEASDRLVFIGQHDLKSKTSGVSYPNFLDWCQQAKNFDALGCYLVRRDHWSITRADPAEAEEYVNAQASNGFFQALGVKPFLGRLFSEDTEHPPANSGVVISYGFWRRHFAGDPQIIGKPVYWLGRSAATIVGVTPPGFQYPPYGREPVDLWQAIPLGEGEQWVRDRGNRVFNVLGRLREDVDVQQARAEMDMIAARLAAEYPSANADFPRAHIELLQDCMASGKQRALVIMMGAVAFVFLVACANLAGLLFARGVTREREMAVRSALGGTSLRLMRQMLVENLILACLGGGLGVLGATWAIKLLIQTDMVASMLLPAGFFRLDTRVLGFALALSVLGVPLVGLVPSVCCSGIDLARMLASGGRGVLGSRGRNAARMALVTAQVMLTIVLLVAAGLMVRSFVNVVTTDAGFNPENVWAVRLYLDGDGTKQRQLLEQLQAIPGVEKASLAFPSLRGWSYYFCAEGEADTSPDQAPLAEYKIVSPDYFAAMGIRLLKGRFFDERDHVSSQPVAIVDETLAKRYWPDGDAIGKHIQRSKSPDPNSRWLEIVGVVGHIKYQGVEADSLMQIYKSMFQDVHPNASVVLRTAGDPAAFIAPVKDVIRQFDWRPRTGRTLDQILGGPSVMRRLITSLLAVFSGIALFLSAVGVYAITRHSVSRGTQEFGIRMALGADKNDVLKLVFRKGLIPVLAGVAVGLAGTLAVARVLYSLLFELSPWDPVTYVAVSLLLVGVAAAACFLPARRAAKIDPMTALRYE